MKRREKAEKIAREKYIRPWLWPTFANELAKHYAKPARGRYYLAAYEAVANVRHELREQERRRRARRETLVALAVVAPCIAVAVVSLVTGWGF